MNAFQALQAGAKGQKLSINSNTGNGKFGNSTTASSDLKKIQPWVEKYRPKQVGAVGGQESTTRVLSKSLGRSDLPHMLFYGPPGTGKTSTILALARELFGPELMKSRVLELNASDERGISVVREKVKTFAKIAVSPPSPDFPSPPFKIIILDEADSMTQDAQSALRRIMETYSKITRFCLICNYVTRIIEPIVSRCSKFRFKPLAAENALSRLTMICEAEQVNASPEVLNTLTKVADGDLRRAITFLQSAARLHSPATTTTDQSMQVEHSAITTSEIEEIGGVVPEHEISRLCQVLGAAGGHEDVDMSREVKSNFDKVQSEVARMVRHGFATSQVLSQLHDRLLLDPLLSTKPKSKIAIAMGVADKALNDGADEELQLLHVCLQVHAAIAAE